jgi:predicted transcriptional regulator/transcriptional regulator with XRE-family HTH domain
MARLASRSVRGGKLRRLRRDLGLTQVQMAERLGLSASYLNLIEHDQRPLTLKVLLRLGEVFGVDLNLFAGDEEAQLAAELAEAFADSALADPAGGARPEPAELREFAAVSAGAARGVIALYRAHRRLRDEADSLAERLRDSEFLAGVDREFRTLLTSIRSFSEILHDNPELEPAQRQRFLGVVVHETERLLAVVDRVLAAGPPAAGGLAGARPAAEEVADLLQERMNHFPEVESLAERLRAAADLGDGTAVDRLSGFLERSHGLCLGLLTRPPADGALRVFDPAARSLAIAEVLTPALRAAELAHVLALLEGDPAFDAALAQARLSTPEARVRARVALADYAALAMLMPYEPFRAAARELRYDVDRLALRFGVGFEQICRRLVTLQRPGERGVPFYYVTLDLAGHVFARFSAAPVRIPRYSGVCPLWNVHAAFLTPGLPRVQLSRMPDGTAYLSIARTVERPGWGAAHTRRIIAVELGCETAHAGDLAYADGLDLDSEPAAVPIGTTCRLCERPACPERALPPVQSTVTVDENRRLPGVLAAL